MMMTMMKTNNNNNNNNSNSNNNLYLAGRFKSFLLGISFGVLLMGQFQPLLSNSGLYRLLDNSASTLFVDLDDNAPTKLRVQQRQINVVVADDDVDVGTTTTTTTTSAAAAATAVVNGASTISSLKPKKEEEEEKIHLNNDPPHDDDISNNGGGGGNGDSNIHTKSLLRTLPPSLLQRQDQVEEEEEEEQQPSDLLPDTTTKTNHNHRRRVSKVYLYPSPKGQSPEELMECFTTKYPNVNITNDYDSNATMLFPVHIQEDIAEWFLYQQLKMFMTSEEEEEESTTTGIAITTNISDADYYIVNMMPVLSDIVDECNGMTHMTRQMAWSRLLKKETSVNNYNVVESSKDKNNDLSNHMFICQSWCCFHSVSLGLKSFIFKSNMTYLIHERNLIWVHRYKVHIKQNIDPSNILVIPYVAHSGIIPFTTTSTKKEEEEEEEEEEEHSKRKHRVTFIGSINRDSEWRYPIQNLTGIYYKDLGMVTLKPDVFDLTNTIMKNEDDYSAYATIMKESIFCLIPSGDTPSSRRLFDAMLAGCIPVFVGIEYDMPFDEGENGLIPYDEFTIRLNNTNWLGGSSMAQNEIDQLWSISDERIVELRRKMGQYIDYLNWRDMQNQSVLRAIIQTMDNRKMNSNNNNNKKKKIRVVDWL